MTPRLNPGATLILGGARSGKSRLAERMVEASGREAIYIATGRAFDAEMEARIAEHRARRGGPWRTVEAPFDLVGAIAGEAGEGRVLLVDCLTLWLTNLMLEERDVPAECDALVSALRTLAGPAILVSNEVGLGIVPDNAMARAFRDHGGRLHQAVAEIAGTVLFVAAGLPLTLKSFEE